MAKGKVKWFNNAKGYGFILPESGEGDLFVHYSSIEMEGYKTLKAGQEVEFDTVAGPKGQHAVNIRHLSVEQEDGGPSPPELPLDEPSDSVVEPSDPVEDFPDQDE